MTGSVKVVDGLSVVHGIPLSEEQGIGPLTLGGYLREIAERYGPREAAVIHLPEKVVRWSYDELYARSMEVA